MLAVKDAYAHFIPVSATFSCADTFINEAPEFQDYHMRGDALLCSPNSKRLSLLIWSFETMASHCQRVVEHNVNFEDINRIGLSTIGCVLQCNRICVRLVYYRECIQIPRCHCGSPWPAWWLCAAISNRGGTLRRHATQGPYNTEPLLIFLGGTSGFFSLSASSGVISRLQRILSMLRFGTMSAFTVVFPDTRVVLTSSGDSFSYSCLLSTIQPLPQPNRRAFLCAAVEGL
ncbi:hypothetical protein N1851_001765 [Merluccius polli]|uniref:Uncharacterized protein n=1 Tax=Merluccius polli TaxID=89951 RepID=A0AA47PBF2_MERPO|nr:hypothetical protein N1851_001765 [Merluccius polli]